MARVVGFGSSPIFSPLFSHAIEAAILAHVLLLVERADRILVPMPTTTAPCAERSRFSSLQLVSCDLPKSLRVTATELQAVPVLLLGRLVGHVGLVQLLGDLLGHYLGLVLREVLFRNFPDAPEVVEVRHVDTLLGPPVPPFLSDTAIPLRRLSALPRFAKGSVLHDGRLLQLLQVVHIAHGGQEVEFGSFFQSHPVHEDPCSSDVREDATALHQPRVAAVELPDILADALSWTFAEFSEEL